MEGILVLGLCILKGLCDDDARPSPRALFPFFLPMVFLHIRPFVFIDVVGWAKQDLARNKK